MRRIELCLLRRKNRLHKKFFIFEIAIVRSNGMKKPVIEKIGSFDLTYNKLIINIFRLIFWICYDISVSYLCFKLLSEFYFFDFMGEFFNKNNVV
jgi:hypothetical protein